MFKRPLSRLGLAAVAAGLFAAPSLAQKTYQFDGTGMTIPAGAPGTTAGPGSLHPSALTVSGVSGPIGEVKVQLTGFSHTFPIDLNVLLVGPSGQTVLLMNRVGGSTTVSNANYLFVDGAPSIPNESAVGSGRYSPSQRPFGTAIAAPAPAGPYGNSLSVFKGRQANGLWSLYIQDEAGGDVGAIAGWSLIITEAPTVANARPVAIPGTGDSGPGNPYPSTAIVDGVEGDVESVAVQLNGLTHSWSADNRILLVSPSGQTCLLYGRCGSSAPVSGAILFITDLAPINLPEGPIVSGTYRPTSCYGLAGDAFSAPAPAPPYGATLSVFNGSQPNGAWRLYVDDAAGGDTGSLVGGWTLVINGEGFCGADFNKSGIVSVQDIYDFLSAWNAGCP